MAKTCIAVDIGASSGRVIAGTLQDNKMIIKEIYRFKNNMIHLNNHCYWDIDHLFAEIIKGLKKLSKKHINIQSIGIDTWAADYVLLDDKNRRISPVFSYRDDRTNGIMEEFFKLIDPKKIYEKTGIQFLKFNTIYQLYEHVKTNKEIVDKIDTFLMVPDYLNYMLCKVKALEFTNSTTTQLFNIHYNDWDDELVSLTGLNKKYFPKTVKPGKILGLLTKETEGKTGLANVKVIAPATHDTGSAVVSVPAADDDFAYISSGTWSLMGIESKTPILTEKAMDYNFTNEGGAFDTYRVLKNIMGLWLIQEVQRLYDNKYSFADLAASAEKAKPFKCLIKPNNSRFLNPENMIEEIKAYCLVTKQPAPELPGEIARCIFESLAFQYKEVLIQLREIQDKKINKIHIIGGGVQNKFLNQLSADFTDCKVLAGPTEATAIGNLAVQFITLGEIKSVEKAREVILHSFNIEKYTPIYNSQIQKNWDKFKKLK